MNNQLRKNFTITPNELIDDEKISPQARFLFVWLASKPDDWRYHSSVINKALGVSDDTRRKYMNELALNGWISKCQKKLQSGQWGENDIILHPSPNFSGTVKTPSPKKSETVKNGNGKSTAHNKTDLLTNTDLFQQDEIPFVPKTVILYLNEKKGGRGFDFNSTNYTEIKARIKDGYKLPDFKKVIDAAIIKWLDDPQNKHFIRPETLFGKKFNGYLIEADDYITGKKVPKHKIEKPNDTSNHKQPYVFSADRIIAEQTGVGPVE